MDTEARGEMTEQPKLSKPQRRVVRLMEQYSTGKVWDLVALWDQETMQIPSRSTMAALVRRGIVRRCHPHHLEYWELVPEAERVPVPDDDSIPF